MSFRYGKQTFALELGMIFVALLFLFPIYVLVGLSLKSAPEISGGGLGLPSSAGDRELLAGVERRAPRRRARSTPP